MIHLRVSNHDDDDDYELSQLVKHRHRLASHSVQGIKEVKAIRNDN